MVDCDLVWHAQQNVLEFVHLQLAKSAVFRDLNFYKVVKLLGVDALGVVN